MMGYGCSNLGSATRILMGCLGVHSLLSVFQFPLRLLSWGHGPQPCVLGGGLVLSRESA